MKALNRVCGLWLGLVLGLMGVVVGADDSRSERGIDEIKAWDKNQNGLLESDEIPSSSRRIAYKLAERSGVNPGQPLPLDKILAAVAERRDRDSSSSSPMPDAATAASPAGSTPPITPATAASGSATGTASNSSSGNGSSKSDSSSKPLVPGFGEKDATGKVPGFDVPVVTLVNKPIEQVYDPRVVDRVRRVLRDNDRNNDGTLDADEIKKSSWTNPPIEESDLNKDGKMSMVELAERYRKRYDWNGPPDPNANTSGGGRSSSGSSSSGDSKSGSGGDGGKLKGYAESLLKQYDQNKNGLLEKDEWKEMKSEHHKADQNGDNVITLEELTLRLAAITGVAPGGGDGSSGSGSSSGSSSASRSGSSSSSSPSSPGISKSALAAAKKAGRFLTPTERLPKGLPDWFLRNDADGDGQIMMVEYAAAWSEATALEFAKYDLDGDGLITPEECLDALKKK